MLSTFIFYITWGISMDRMDRIDKKMGCFTFMFLFFLIVLLPNYFLDKAGYDDAIKGIWIFISSFALIGYADGTFKKILNLFK